MRQGRAYQLLSWGAAAAVALVLFVEWILLYRLHAHALPPQIDRRAIVSKHVVDLVGICALGPFVLGVIWRAWRRTAPILAHEALAMSAELGPAASARAAAAAAKEVALNAGMRECYDLQQWAAHQLLMWGFLGLVATTSLDMLTNFAAAPLPLLHPVRILGNLTGIAFMMGLTLALARRALLARVRSVTQLGDWSFLQALWGTGATGFAVQYAADATLHQATTWLYVLHLVFITTLLATAPWTKFIHAAWRPTWVLYRSLIAERGET